MVQMDLFISLNFYTQVPHRMSKSVEDIQHHLLRKEGREGGRKGEKRGKEDTAIVLENKGELYKGSMLIHNAALRNLSSPESI